MKVLITGGAGFIGTNISIHLKKTGLNPTALDNFSKSGSKKNAELLKKSGIKTIKFDVKNKLPRKFSKFDAIIHLAAIGSTPYSIKHPLEDFMNSALGTMHVLELAKKTKIPVLYSSTCKVYSSEINTFPTKEKKYRYVWDFDSPKVKKLRKAVTVGITKYGVNENFPMDSSGSHPHAPYGVSHAVSDIYCQEYYHMYDVPTVVNRMSTIYGINQSGTENQGWVDWVVKSKLKGEPLNLVTNGKTVRDILWIDDLAELFYLELKNVDRVKGKVFNVGGGHKNTLSIREAIKYLDKKFNGKKTEFVFKEKRPADQKIYISDIRKVVDVLNWEPELSYKEGLEKLWEFHNNQK